MLAPMVSPFPGMDPYLEHPSTWMDVHTALIAELRRTLGPLLQPHYVVRLEERSYLDAGGLAFLGRPDVAIERSKREGGVREGPRRPSVTVEVPLPERVRETWLEVRRPDGAEVVTVLEILSPGNKRPGAGRSAYEKKRLRVLGSATHLVEIDLLRAGEPMPVAGEGASSDYRILVSRGDQRPEAQLYAFSVREAIPAFPLPLRGGVPEPDVSLRAMLDVVYATGGYGSSVDYESVPVPPLEPADAAWATEFTRAGR